ncbi:MAG: hypothetical protein DWQ05_10705 [Calditrichaeota bacterium]|nr:MAG: hypothetical protein DWQ05_10705 [Calditrichota bacterium]
MRILIFLGFALLQLQQLSAQHYLTFGAGYSSIIFNSDELDQLEITYNYVNSPNLSRFMTGIRTGDGVRIEAGYRYLKKWSAAVNAGFQYYSGFDGAAFNNGQGRNLDLKIKQFFLDSEFGHTFRNYFFNGLLTAYFARDLKLISEYTGPEDEIDRPISGTFKGDVNFALDAGISIGLHKEPFMLIGKITYPVYSAADSDKLVKKGGGDFNSFPSDFVQYTAGESYEALTNEIDGLKIMLSFVFVLGI